MLEVPITSDDFSQAFPSFGTGRYRLQVMRLATGAASVENVSSPIYLEPTGVGRPIPTPTTTGWRTGTTTARPWPTPGRRDLDGDGLGDACDADRDGMLSPTPTITVPRWRASPPMEAARRRVTAAARCQNRIRGTRAPERLVGTAGN